MRHARLQRGAYESIDKAWAARTITAERIAALIRQIDADRKVISAYQKEYELGQRSLIDLLNAQNQLFNAGVSLESTRGVAIFADYQLLAAMGELLAYLKAPKPIDADPLVTRPLLLMPTKIAPILLGVPPGSEPLDISNKSSNSLTPGVIKATEPGGIFLGRWPTASNSTSLMAGAPWLSGTVASAPALDAQAAAPTSEIPATAFAPSYANTANWPFKTPGAAHTTGAAPN